MKLTMWTFSALILALAMAGVAYAHWSETLYINGAVNTGVLDAQLVAGPSWDTDDYAEYGQLISPDKDVSDIYCYVDYNADPHGHVLKVVVSNAYPSIQYYQLIHLVNSGSIPLHIYDITYDLSGMPVGSTVELLPYHDYPNIAESTQVHQSEAAWGVIHVHLPQNAEEDEEYSFTITIEVVQWNYP